MTIYWMSSGYQLDLLVHNRERVLTKIESPACVCMGVSHWRWICHGVVAKRGRKSRTWGMSCGLPAAFAAINRHTPPTLKPPPQARDRGRTSYYGSGVLECSDPLTFAVSAKVLKVRGCETDGEQEFQKGVWRGAATWWGASGDTCVGGTTARRDEWHAEN